MIEVELPCGSVVLVNKKQIEQIRRDGNFTTITLLSGRTVGVAQTPKQLQKLIKNGK